jgi:hypothetical protein
MEVNRFEPKVLADNISSYEELFRSMILVLGDFFKISGLKK